MIEHAQLSVATLPCPNCEAPVGDRFCGGCGQRQGSIDLSVWQLLRQFASEVTSVDGRLLRTLRPLVLRPGELTAQYLVGRRRHYSSPLRLYLGASFAFFAGFLLTRSIDRAYYGLADPGGGVDYANAMARLLILALPLLALFLKLIYLRSGRPLVHHLVFSLHFGAAALLWTLLMTLTAAGLKAAWGHYSASPAWLPDFVYWLYLPGMLLLAIYLLVAVRRTYARGWWYSAGATLALVVGVGSAFHFSAPTLLRVLGSW
jgi:hypothetical protein